MRTDFQGVSYPDRHKILASEGATLTIYVPKPGFETMGLAPRSGIVGGEPGDDLDGLAGSTRKILCHYEGWVHSAYQYESLDPRGKWEAAVVHAAGRAFVHYPTVARGIFDADGLTPVGTIAATGSFTITDENAVNEWLNR